MATLIPKDIQDYIDFVRSGEYAVCKDQLLLCNLIEKVFDEEDLFCDEERFQKYMNLQKYFPFDLLPWERFIFYLHNCVFKANGLPRFADLFVLVGRGSG